MAPFAGCECGAEERNVDHVFLHCPIHRPPMERMACLIVLGDVTIKWLLNTCPEI